MSKKTQNFKSNPILLGEGHHQHNLRGDFNMEVNHGDFAPIQVLSDSTLCHEEPSGAPAEHETLLVNPGNWRMGRQVEKNPFNESVTRIWD